MVNKISLQIKYLYTKLYKSDREEYKGGNLAPSLSFYTESQNQNPFPADRLLGSRLTAMKIFTQFQPGSTHQTL